jgi:hypothetical protein
MKLDSFSDGMLTLALQGYSRHEMVRGDCAGKRKA